MENKSTFEYFDQLSLDQPPKSFLSETGKWSNIISIFGYIGVGFMILAGLFMAFTSSNNSGLGSTTMGSSFGIGLAFFYLAIGVLYIFPIYYLNKFATNIKSAIQSNDNLKLNEAFGFLKSHYKFMAIFMLVFIAIYLLAIIGIMIYGSNFI